MRKTKRRIEMGEEKWKEYQRERKNNKAFVWKAKRAQSVVNWRRRAKQKLIEYKGGKCEMCGFSENHPSCYDFHHMKKKDFTISGKTFSFSKLKQEVDKCKLLCKNCHAKIHEQEYDNQREETVKKYKIWLAST